MPKKGYVMTVEHKQKIKEALKGKTNAGQFKKGQKRHPNWFKATENLVPWNKGVKMGANPEHSKRMKGRTPWNKGLKYGTYERPEGYHLVHKWLIYNYGSANRCDNTKCEQGSIKYQWALRRGNQYVRDVNCYIQLCQSCHQHYDRNNEYQIYEKQGNTYNKIRPHGRNSK